MFAVSAPWAEILSRIDRIRLKSRSKTFTNCFFSPSFDMNLLVYTSESAVVFLMPDDGFSRLYYHASDFDSLSTLLHLINLDETLVIGYVDRVRNYHLCLAFIQSDFIEKAHYIRMVIRDIPKTLEGLEPTFACIADLERIMHLLKTQFNPIKDHLPLPSRIAQLINNRQVIVRYVNGVVSGFVIFDVVGKQFHFNYFLNLGPRGDGLLLMQSFFRCITERFVHSGFLWVNRENERAIRFYEASGWSNDGLNDWFFVREIA